MAQKQPEKGAIETENAQKSVYVKTIQERGPVLPLGIADSGGVFHQDISVKPWRMKEERELGELRDQNKDANLAKYVSMVLSTMCTKLGPHDFTSMEFDHKRLVISQMFMADVFYAYVWLRIQSLGNLFPIKFQPSWSNKELTIEADLYSTEVRIPTGYDAACWKYELKNPLQIRGNTVKEFNLAPLRWSSIESHDAVGTSANQGLAKLILIMASTIGLDSVEGQVVLTEAELDEMSKLDIERLAFLIDENALGPRMAVEGTYQGRAYKAPLDWGYDNFFGISSV